jgi:hypothetical protein
VRPVVWPICLLGWLFGACAGAAAQFTRDDWWRANEATVRLSPSAFRNLPAEVRAALERRGGTIPRPYDARGPETNVISGEFTSTGQTDWAVLCSRERQSAILVFDGKHFDQVDEIAQGPDLKYLQVVSGGREIAYSRRLSLLKPSAIRQHFARSANVPQKIDHDGIDDRFVGKASVAWYRSSGKWVKLSGAD